MVEMGSFCKSRLWRAGRTWVRFCRAHALDILGTFPESADFLSHSALGMVGLIFLEGRGVKVGEENDALLHCSAPLCTKFSVANESGLAR